MANRQKPNVFISRLGSVRQAAAQPSLPSLRMDACKKGRRAGHPC
ncbi:hypothetical protein GS8_2557 [Geobacillus stearothermophilus]|uniref:Uncharacterized protein n=1 Tax=Geobacillus stearothermophilus TaxID=1422 RepID=A0ABQ7HDY1_GEOSE|nr:hypothetical protein GS8_2557 [Geobacillus stearothermophilus]